MIFSPPCDILITYIPKPSPHYSKTLSGHFFEIFDYYYLLRNYSKVQIWLPEVRGIDIPRILKIINTRYQEPFNENDLVVGDFKLIKVPAVLCVDNCYHYMKLHRNMFACEKFYSFACGDSKFFAGLEPENIILLADSRIYDFNKFNCEAINYVKKVYPGIKRCKNPVNRAFAHITKSCKAISQELLGELTMREPNICIYSDYLVHPNVTKEPILDFNFTKFIYTPIERKFDCSNRLVIECFIHNIPVEYWIQYTDNSLELRRQNPQEFVMQKDDEIARIFGCSHIRL